jgi:DNA-directed RNA polymerase specialized sigma24 family protein
MQPIVVDQRTLEARFDAARKHYAGTIRTFARNCVFQLPGFDLEDIQQELLVVLWRCVKNYDPNRGAGFNTLFQGSARNHVIGLVRTANAQKRGKGQITTLSDEAFTTAVERMSIEGSAEDWYFAIAEYGDRFVSELELAAG